MKRSLAALVAALVLGAPSAVLGESSGTVPAQVEVAAPCITIDAPGSVDYGTLAFSTDPNSPRIKRGSPDLGFNNCGVGDEHVFVNGMDARDTFPTPDPPTAVWSLVGGSTCPQLNQYRINVSQPTTTGTGIVLSNELQELEVLGAGAADQQSTDLFMPCSGSDGAGKTMGFFITLTATF